MLTCNIPRMQTYCRGNGTKRFHQQIPLYQKLQGRGRAYAAPIPNPVSTLPFKFIWQCPCLPAFQAVKGIVFQTVSFLNLSRILFPQTGQYIHSDIIFLSPLLAQYAFLLTQSCLLVYAQNWKRQTQLIFYSD